MLTKIQMHKFDEVVMMSARLANIGTCPDAAAARESGDSGGGDSCQKFAIWQAIAATIAGDDVSTGPQRSSIAKLPNESWYAQCAVS
jgi:hypothetical protein